jgi:hypothetical protein
MSLRVLDLEDTLNPAAIPSPAWKTNALGNPCAAASQRHRGQAAPMRMKSAAARTSMPSDHAPRRDHERSKAGRARTDQGPGSWLGSLSGTVWHQIPPCGTHIKRGEGRV